MALDADALFCLRGECAHLGKLAYSDDLRSDLPASAAREQPIDSPAMYRVGSPLGNSGNDELGSARESTVLRTVARVSLGKAGTALVPSRQRSRARVLFAARAVDDSQLHGDAP